MLSIAGFYRGIGRAEELGSGFRNTIYYTMLYSGGLEPDFEEGDVFKISIPLKIEVEGVNPEVEGVNPEVEGAIDGAIEGAIEGTVKGPT